MRNLTQIDNIPQVTLKTLFENRVSSFLSPLESFIKLQTTASVLLVALSIAALIISNSPWRDLLSSLAHFEIGMVLGQGVFSLSLNEFVSQGLMAFFFFLTGMEIKREILAGKLSDRREISLILVAALGGILVPALLYYLINFGGDGHHGWGIPTATDTAFAIGILALFASRVSLGLTVFLTALAIFDDVGAIIIISIFYAHDVNVQALICAAIVFGLLTLGNKAGIRAGWFYAIMGLLLWIAVFNAGIHATFAGILLAITIPARAVISQSRFILDVRKLVLKFEQKQDTDISMLGSHGKHSIVSDIGQSSRSASTPLQRWEGSIVVPIAILVLPLFAFLNAGFVITYDLLYSGMGSPITIGIIAGLVIGKPLGIVLFSYLFSRTKWGKLPSGVTLYDVASAGLLAGIGFTMSIFFTTLSFPNQTEQIELAKLGIIISSIVSAILGSIWIWKTALHNRSI